MEKYRKCATCVNFVFTKSDSEVSYFCKRLGFETKPTYSFDCWVPKPHIVKLLEKNSENNHNSTEN